MGYNIDRQIMKKINIRRIYYRLRTKYFTLNNAVILVAFMIAAGWVWGSLGVMQRNYTLQKELDDKNRQLILAQLDTDRAKLQQRYFQTNEYQELAVRERLGLVTPGESVLILPANSQVAINADKANPIAPSAPLAPVSNFQQWMNFLLGSK